MGRRVSYYLKEVMDSQYFSKRKVKLIKIKRSDSQMPADKPIR